MIGFLANLIRGPGVSYETPAELKTKYRHLYDAQVELTEDGARFERARLWRRRGINVLHVTGDRFEMAFQHGRLLRAEIATGTLHKAGMIANHGIRNSMGDGLLSRIGSSKPPIEVQLS